MTFIPVNEPLLLGNEEKYVVESIRTGWISSEGPFVARFEKEFAQYVDRKHGISVSNGTAALDVAIAALGIGPGDEVIVPTFTIISCITQILRSGATPVFVDCDPETLNMDVGAVSDLITDRTKAVVIVHIYGLPVDMDPLLEVCSDNNVTVIEDAAEMHGQTYKGRKCGSFGLISTFSFYANKTLTTGEGGMIVTDDDALAERCRGLRNLAFKPNDRFIHDELGWNYRLTNMQAALGVAQLERADDAVLKKRKIGRYYQDAFSDLACIRLPTLEMPYAKNIFWVYGIILNEEIRASAKEVMLRLGELKIGTRPFFFPLHKQPVLEHFGLSQQPRLPNSEFAYKKGFYIPSGMALTTQQQDIVISAVRSVINEIAQ